MDPNLVKNPVIGVVNPEALFSVRGKNYVVTGASSGLGRRFSRILSAAGANVVMAARRLEKMEIESGDLPRSVRVRCDVRDPEQIERALDIGQDAFGPIDGLLNVAGISRSSEALVESVDEFRSVVETNLVSVFVASKAFANRAVGAGRGGVVVNVASVLGTIATTIPLASYTASKSGVVNLTRDLAVQWAPLGIRVNALAPGWFESEMTEAMFAEQSLIDWMSRRSPLNRPGRADELDGAVIFLLSDASSFMIGQTLVVDGGWTLT